MKRQSVVAMKCRTELVGITVMALLFGASNLLAQPKPDAGKPKVYCFTFVKGEGVSEVVFNKIHKYFLTLFKMSTKLELLSDEELTDAEKAKAKEEKRKSTQVSAPWLEKADGLLWQGKDLLVKNDFQGAIKNLEEAKQLYEEHYLELRDYDKLVDATLQLAISFFMAGYKDNGEELLKEVLVWRPDTGLERKKYPKEFMDSLDSLKALMENRKGGTVRVEVTPSEGAKIFVDGILKGTLAAGQDGVDILGLYRGKHYIQVTKDGYQIWAQKAGVPELGRTSKIVAELTAAAEEAPEETSGEWEALAFQTYQFAVTGDYAMKFSQTAKKFADKAQVPYLLFGFVSQEKKGTKLTLFLFKSEWSGLAEVEPVSFDENLTNLQVNLLFLEANLASSLAKFPKEKVVRGEPEVYRLSREAREKAQADLAKAEAAKAEPVKTEPAKTEPVKTEPAKTEPAKTEPVKVVKKEETQPVRVTPTLVEEQPELTSRTEPAKTKTSKPEEDLGDLSSIFSSGSEGSGEGAVVGTSLPVVREDKKKKKSKKKVTKQWWFWTVTGAVVAGGLAVGIWGIVEGTQSESGNTHTADGYWY
jgi:hypothetical protein